MNNTEMFTAHNPLTALLTRSRLKTCAELRSIIGQPYAVCPVCGSPLFSITNLGEAICWGCDWERSQATKGIALRIVVLAVTAAKQSTGRELSQVAAGNGPGGAGEVRIVADVGVGVAADYDVILEEREQAARIDAGAYYLNRAAHDLNRIVRRRWRIIPIDNTHYPRPPRDKTAEEWFKGLPQE